MRVIVLAAQKGGSGKSTTAAHLAVHAEAVGDGPVVLVDLDPQRSLALWWHARKAEVPALAETTPEQLPDKIAALRKGGFAVAVIDTPPAVTDSISAALRCCDLALIPARPSPHDLRAVGATVALARDARRPFAFVVTQARAGTHLAADAVAALGAHGPVAPVFLQARQDYAASMVDGRTAQEADPKGRSAAEVAALWDFVKSCFPANPKGRKSR